MLAAEWCGEKPILESECYEAIKAVVDGYKNNSSFVFVIRETLEASTGLPEFLFRQ